MPSSTNHATESAIKTNLDVLARLASEHGPPVLTQAVQALLTAKEYDDPALMLSSANAVFEALRDLIEEYIGTKLGISETIAKGFKEFQAMVRCHPFDELDVAGRAFEAGFNRILKHLTDIQAAVGKLQANDYEVPSAAQLGKEIERLKALKQKVLNDWPWSSASPPPVDREMVARSRAAISRGESCESIEELIGRLSEDYAKND